MYYFLNTDQFTVTSKRHYGMPFGMSLYVNGLINCRISSCCEYKHKQGQVLGGGKSSANFRLLKVEGGQPCYLCKFGHANQSKLFPPAFKPKVSTCT